MNLFENAHPYTLAWRMLIVVIFIWLFYANSVPWFAYLALALLALSCLGHFFTARELEQVRYLRDVVDRRAVGSRH